MSWVEEHVAQSSQTADNILSGRMTPKVAEHNAPKTMGLHNLSNGQQIAALSAAPLLLHHFDQRKKI